MAGSLPFSARVLALHLLMARCLRMQCVLVIALALPRVRDCHAARCACIGEQQNYACAKSNLYSKMALNIAETSGAHKITF